MQQLELIVSSDPPPPPMLDFSDETHEKVYRVMCMLEPGQHVRWPKAPRAFVSLVRRWVVKAQLPQIKAFREVDGDGIIQKLYPEKGHGFPITAAIDEEDEADDQGPDPVADADGCAVDTDAPGVVSCSMTTKAALCPSCSRPLEPGGVGRAR